MSLVEECARLTPSGPWTRLRCVWCGLYHIFLVEAPELCACGKPVLWAQARIPKWTPEQEERIRALIAVHADYETGPAGRVWRTAAAFKSLTHLWLFALAQLSILGTSGTSEEYLRFRCTRRTTWLAWADVSNLLHYPD